MRPLRRPLRVSVLATSCAALLLTASACGGGGGSSFASESATAITAAAKKDTTSATSVHLKGDITQSGKQMSIDLQLDDQGDCQGSITLAGGSSAIIGTGGQYWIKPDAAFWMSQEPAEATQIIAAVGDKYVVAPDSSDFKSVCDLNSLFDDDSSKDKNPTTAGTTSVDGKETVEVKTTDTEGNPSEAYVLTSSPHYVVKLVGEGDSAGNDKGEFSLTDFGAKLDVTAPDPSDVFDLSSLGG